MEGEFMKKIKGKKSFEELCNFEEDNKKNLDKIKVMDENELEEFLKGAKVEKEFKF